MTSLLSQKQKRSALAEKLSALRLMEAGQFSMATRLLLLQRGLGASVSLKDKAPPAVSSGR